MPEQDPPITSTRVLNLARALNAWACPVCGGNGPRIIKTEGAVRYVRCRYCKYPGPLGCKLFADLDEPEPETPPKPKTPRKR